MSDNRFGMGLPPGFAQLDTDLQELTRSINRLIVQTSLGVVVPIAQGGTGATTAPGALTNLGVGSAGTKTASNPADANVASVLLPVTTGHLAVFADINGTIEDGGTLPGSFGSAATKAASNPAQPDLASIIGVIIPGHIAIFADANGTIEDGGVLGTIAAQTYATGSWTPSLLLGGAATGITYGTQLGSYTRIGREIACRFRIVLTSQGIVTGAATISGLPFASNADVTNNGSGGLVTVYANMSGLSMAPIINVGPGSSAISLLTAGAAATAPLTDSSFTNTAAINGSFTYFV